MSEVAEDVGSPPPGSNERPRLVADGGLVVLAYCFPPIAVGPSFILARLLGQFDLSQCVVFSGNPECFPARDDEFAAPDVEIRRRDVPVWWPMEDASVRAFGGRVRLRLRAVGNVVVGVRVAFEAVRALRSKSVRALLVVYPKQHFLLAAAIASAFSRKPLFAYFMDTYAEALPHARRIARLLERRVLRRASVIFAMSDAHREHIQARLRLYGVPDKPVVELPHVFAARDVPALPALLGRPSIVFTGAIYDAQADAIRRVVDALDDSALADLDPVVHLLSPMDAEWVESLGIRVGSRVLLRDASSDEAIATQRSADILLLPIAFDLKPQQARTASPSKIAEYLASGRPILAHAPPDSYVARYARERGFAELVDVPDTATLAAAIRRVATDEARRAELRRAAERTFARHRVDVVAEVFRAAIAEAL